MQCEWYMNFKSTNNQNLHKKMNYLAASCRGIKIEISFFSMQALEY